MTKSAEKKIRRRIVYVTVFVLLAAVIITAGFLVYRNYQSQFRSKMERDLTAIVEQKVSELANWRRGRLNDALLFFQNGVFSILVRRYLENPADLKAQIEIRIWLSHLRTARQYDRLMLLDDGFFKKITIPATEERNVSFVSPISAADLRAGKVAFEDFYWNEANNKIYIKILVPIFEAYNGNLPKAILAMRIDPNDYLYPLIQHWPTPSQTAETLLVRRDGNNALYLNELKFQKNAALKLRIPLSDKNVPAVMAVLGKEGIVEGRDYRGMPVIAVLRSIPDSPWFLVARIDKAEVFAPLRERLRVIIIIVLVLIFSTGFGLALIQRRRQVFFYKAQVETAQELLESQANLNAITNSAQDAILMMDPQGRLTFWNPAAERIFGHSRTEAIGRNLHDLIVPRRYHAAHHAAFPEFLRTGQGAAMGKTLELQGLHKDGHEIDVAISLSAVQIQESWHAVGIVRDITAKKRAEAAQRQIEEHLQLALNASHAVAWVGDLKTDKVIEIGPVAAVFGKPEGFLHVGLSSLLEDIYPEDRAHFIAGLQAGAGGEYAVEFRIMLADGGMRWLQATGRFEGDPGGPPIRVQGITFDITERKQMEFQKEIALAALSESEERFRRLSASAQDAILMMDDKGRLTFWNGAAERIFGYSENEALGANLHKLIAPPRYQQAHHAAFPEFLRTGRGAAVGQTLELQALRQDGREITVALSLSAVQVKGSWHAVGILRDISKQKIAEKELYNLLDELEQANNRLNAANQRANQLAVEAQAANIAKSQFLANMSHEIRTPMNGVIGMIELLMGTVLSTEQRRYAETVRLSGEALLGVLNDILDFSKIEADKLELETIDFDLRATFEDAAELLAVRAQEKNLEFICRVDPEVQTFLNGDPGRLRQIVINLGSNAIKFTARGEIFIEVKLESESAQQIKIRVTVRDTGIGIPADKLGLLFSAFQQVDASTTRRFGGSGLGLAISKRLVEAMDGEIGVQSVEGRGSTFWFTAAFGKQPPRDREIESSQAKIGGVRILVVDDNATNRLILSEQLASWQARHAEAASATQALDMLRIARAQGDPFRIVISDLQMPEMDGESLGKSIKTDPELCDTILVMMTSLGRRGDAKRFKAIGFSAYLTKPVKQSQLYDCLATVIGGPTPEINQAEQALVTRHTISEARRLKVRILLVEDNLTNQQVALGILEKLGFRSDVAGNGREAITALETVVYDLVLMDVQMPVMDGFEATAVIRSGHAAVLDAKIPIIAMTAHAMKGDRERCLAAGMDDYISKPIAPQALIAVIAKWLDQTAKLPDAIPAAPAGPLVFDRQAFMERLMNDLDLVKEISAGFLQDMPEQIQMLARHIGRGNVKAAGLQAHSIKGAAANVGGLALSAAALALEQAAQAKCLDEVTALLPELERQFQLLQVRMLENEP